MFLSAEQVMDNLQRGKLILNQKHTVPTSHNMLQGLLLGVGIIFQGI